MPGVVVVVVVVVAAAAAAAAAMVVTSSCKNRDSLWIKWYEHLKLIQDAKI
jgi:hypothetical protein